MEKKKHKDWQIGLLKKEDKENQFRWSLQTSQLKVEDWKILGRLLNSKTRLANHWNKADKSIFAWVKDAVMQNAL